MGTCSPVSAKTGYRILGIDEGGPMSGLALEPMLDFIVYPDTRENEGRSFSAVLDASRDSALELSVYNLASQSVRKVIVTPKNWNGRGLLGIRAREENFATAHVRVMRVLSFLPCSPLQKAEFVPMKDYILGTTERVFADLDEFESFIQQHNGEALDLWVYNSSSDSVRMVRITPDSRWGGDGFLGGDIGFGTAHAIPKRNEVTLFAESRLMAPSAGTSTEEKKGTTMQSEVELIEKPEASTVERLLDVTGVPPRLETKAEKGKIGEVKAVNITAT